MGVRGVLAGTTASLAAAACSDFAAEPSLDMSMLVKVHICGLLNMRLRGPPRAMHASNQQHLHFPVHAMQLGVALPCLFPPPAGVTSSPPTKR